MRIAVCIRQGLDGEINPFDAAALEAALRIADAEVIPVSMGPARVGELLLRLTRLGAREAVLLSDAAFAGADTLATAYTLSLAMKRLQPDLIFCGRQTLVGDTAQTGTMLAVMAKTALITNVMSVVELTEEGILCETRERGRQQASLPALLTFERIHALRLPSLRSKVGTLHVWSAKELDADLARCGLAGSPTRVISSSENEGGRRQCRFIAPTELDAAVAAGLKRGATRISPTNGCENKLKNVFSVGEAPMAYAESVCAKPTRLPRSSAEEIAARIRAEEPDAVLFATDAWSRETAARVAAELGLGLCADCTALETDGAQLFMIRPALAGSVMAKIISRTRPAVATVRTASTEAVSVVVAAGFGAADALPQVRALAQRFSATLAASRKAVDNDLLPYECQVGLTGKTVSPAVYIAVGISGAVHHIVGMQRAGTVIAINPDRNAPIFDYADYGIIARAEDIR